MSSVVRPRALLSVGCQLYRKLHAVPISYRAPMTTTLFLAAALLAADPVQADLVLKGGTLYDGSGGEGVIGDVAIKGDRIVAVGQLDVAGMALDR